MACESNPVMYSQGEEYDVASLTKEQGKSIIDRLFPADSNNRINTQSSSLDHHEPVFQLNADYRRRCEEVKTHGVECVYVDDLLEKIKFHPKHNPIGNKAYLVGRGDGPYPPDDGTPIFQINLTPDKPATAVITGDSPTCFKGLLDDASFVKYIPLNYIDNPLPNTVYYPRNFRMDAEKFFESPSVCGGTESSRSTMVGSFRLLWDHGIREIDLYRVSFFDKDTEIKAIEKMKNRKSWDGNDGWYEGSYGEGIKRILRELSPVFEANGLKVRNTTPNSKLGLWET